MRSEVIRRCVVTFIALLVGLSVFACSSDGGDDAQPDQPSQGAGSTDEYCDAVRKATDIENQTSGDRTPEQDEQMLEAIKQAFETAPSDIRAELATSFVGNAAAEESVRQFNETFCLSSP
jgi:hypothetical protein